jgi:hypothetical protein
MAHRAIRVPGPRPAPVPTFWMARRALAGLVRNQFICRQEPQAGSGPRACSPARSAARADRPYGLRCPQALLRRSPDSGAMQALADVGKQWAGDVGASGRGIHAGALTRGVRW